jgi:hypothetical protein
MGSLAPDKALAEGRQLQTAPAASKMPPVPSQLYRSSRWEKLFENYGFVSAAALASHLKTID